MSDDCGHDHSNEDPGSFIFGMPAAGLSEAVQRAREEHERAHMAHDDVRNRILALCRDLSADQLITLRHMLANNREYIDGIVVGALVYVHGVDPVSGLKPEEGLLGPVAGAGPVQPE